VVALELLPREVGERVVAERVRQVLGVVRLDDRVVRREGLERQRLLLDGRVRLGELRLPGGELVVDADLDGVGRERERGSNSDLENKEKILM